LLRKADFKQKASTRAEEAKNRAEQQSEGVCHARLLSQFACGTQRCILLKLQRTQFCRTTGKTQEMRRPEIDSAYHAQVIPHFSCERQRRILLKSQADRFGERHAYNPISGSLPEMIVQLMHESSGSPVRRSAGSNMNLLLGLQCWHSTVITTKCSSAISASMRILPLVAQATHQSQTEQIDVDKTQSFMSSVAPHS